MTRIQQMTVRRDIIVLFRICILLGLLMAFFIPSTIILLIYNFTGYLPWWSSQIQWLVFSLSITSVSIVLALVSPHVRNLCIINTHYHITVRPALSELIIFKFLKSNVIFRISCRTYSK
jgi:hypothetical protein